MTENEKIVQFDEVIEYYEETQYAEITRLYNADEKRLEWWYDETFGVQWNVMVAYKHRSEEIKFCDILDSFEIETAYMSVKEIKNAIKKDSEELKNEFEEEI